MGNIEQVALLCLSSWCLVIVMWPFLMMPRFCLQFVVVVLPDHTHLLFLYMFVVLKPCSHGAGVFCQSLFTIGVLKKLGLYIHHSWKAVCSG